MILKIYLATTIISLTIIYVQFAIRMYGEMGYLFYDYFNWKRYIFPTIVISMIAPLNLALAIISIFDKENRKQLVSILLTSKIRKITENHKYTEWEVEEYNKVWMIRFKKLYVSSVSHHVDFSGSRSEALKFSGYEEALEYIDKIIENKISNSSRIRKRKDK